MTKLLRIALLDVLVFILAFGLIAAAGGAITQAVADAKPNVGWHTSIGVDTLVRQLAATLGPDAQPNVGWNSKSTADAAPLQPVASEPYAKPCVGWNS